MIGWLETDFGIPMFAKRRLADVWGMTSCGVLLARTPNVVAAYCRILSCFESTRLTSNGIIPSFASISWSSTSTGFMSTSRERPFTADSCTFSLPIWPAWGAKHLTKALRRLRSWTMRAFVFGMAATLAINLTWESWKLVTKCFNK